MNQIELEQHYYQAGIARAEAMMERNEQDGNAVSNPYATPIFRRYVLPIAELIQQEKDRAVGGSMPVAVGLVLGIDEAAVAYIAVRAALSHVMLGDDSGTKLTMAIGRDVYRECILSLFAAEKPANYARINEDLKRKASKNPRHRSYVMRRAAEQEGMDIPEWHETDKGHVGNWMLQLLQDVGLLDVTMELGDRAAKGGARKTQRKVHLTEAAASQIENIKDRCVELMPLRFPFVEAPRDWVSLTEGGYHTKRAGRPSDAVKLPHVGRAKAVAQYKDEDTAKLREAMNHLQHSRFAINTEILNVLPKVAQALDAAELAASPETPAPERPAFLDRDEELTPEQDIMFKAWKRAMAEWHTENKLRRTRWARYTTALRMATEFKDYEQLYFLYQADSRSRLYAQTAGINPQGSDMQKALLRFAVGKPLGGADGLRWFMIDGANRYGVDKVPFAERVQWVKNNSDLIRRCAQDPLSNRDWLEADSPLMFLAWAFEWDRYCADPAGFVSYLAVGLDGSCNGLQHYSAMLRDRVGGKAVNLIPGMKPNDIYAQVANVTTDLLKAAEPHELRDLWLAHGITRKLCKRSVMTLPYGSTKHSCRDFILDDYLIPGNATDLPKELYVKLAQYLSDFIWSAIGKVVIAAVAGMSWLQKASGAILKAGAQDISWTTPTGFKVVQRYTKMTEIDIRSKLYANTGVRIYVPTDEPDRNRHKNGIAPNFIHALDAGHMCETILEAKAQGIDDLWMIHDSYGTHACDTEKLARSIRKTFVAIYSNHNPLQEFHALYPDLPKPPATGDLDIMQVLESEYFFA